MTDGSGQPSFFEELKRRKVVRVAAVYGAIVFAVLQVALLLIEPLSLPEWAMRFLVLLGGLGLPVALWLAWIFEVRPEGLRRTAPAEAVPAEQIGQTSLFSRRTVLSVAALLLVGSAVGWFFAPTGVGSESPGDAAPGAGLMEIRPNGIAVLPFASRSAAEGEADFSPPGSTTTSSPGSRDSRPSWSSPEPRSSSTARPRRASRRSGGSWRWPTSWKAASRRPASGSA